MQPKRWRYFSEKEVEGLDPEFVAKLDQMRHIAGIPFVITSGKRDEYQNHTVGGKNKSAHMKGLAVDISAKNSHTVMLIHDAALQVGVNRIGTYILPPQPGEPIQYTHVHVDVDSELPQQVSWIDVCKQNGRIA